VHPPLREHRWTIAAPPDPATVARIAKEINVPDAIARVLVLRGVDDYDRARAYFRPTLDQLHDPFLLGGMRAAVDRLLLALERHEKILVFGDYDVDGTNGAAMHYLFFRELGADVGYTIPDRIKEGYGISRQGIERAHADGVRLFIAIDCGITAVDQIGLAVDLGLDVIICDHHETGATLPPALAVLDPITPGDPDPFKHLCGCGVGFKFVQAVAGAVGRPELPEHYLDFVTLASTADIVPLVDENRVICKIGLQRINENPRPGIRALMESAGLKVGRLGDATRAVRMLTSDDPAEARELAHVLEEENRNRRKIDEDTFAHARQLHEAMDDSTHEHAIVLHQGDWHPGVVGIVASRMVERYYKPSIMMATVDGVAKGSARSISGFDVFEALRRCEDKIIQFGGHKYAAGLTVEIEKVDEFRSAFNAAVRDLMTDELRTPEIRVDTAISLADITPRFFRILREFAPFGPQNMRPVFLSRGLEVVGAPRVVGKNHLRFRVRQNGSVFDAIGFGLAPLLSRVTGGRRDLEAVYTIEENDWSPAGTPRPAEPVPQLKIKDIR
jgi:single-stranded-DNA-specific exonuclease